MPFSPAAERNKKVIGDQLAALITGPASLLEIGSGTGQHALHCSQALPQVSWQCSDRPDYLPALLDNITQSTLANVLPPIELDVMHYAWSEHQYDVIYTANTLHIMSTREVDFFLQQAHLALKPTGMLVIYGPLNYNNAYTSESNREFDQRLRSQHTGSCIK